MKRKHATILVLLIVLAAASTVGYLMYRRTQGEYLRGRAQLAMRANKMGEALALIDQFIRKYPDRWRGYFTKGAIHAHFGEYDKARADYDNALARPECDRREVLLAKARTWSMLAVKQLNSMRHKIRMDMLDSGVKQLQTSNKILLTLLPAAGEDTPGDAELIRRLARNYERLGLYYAMRTVRYQLNLGISETADTIERSEVNRRAFKENEIAAQKTNSTALTYFLRLLKVKPDSENEAVAAMELAMSQRDEAQLAAVAEVIESIPELASAKSLLWMHQFYRASPRLSSKERMDYIVTIQAKLEALIKMHPESTHSKIALTQLAMESGQIERADELIAIALKQSPTDRDVLRTYAMLLRRKKDFAKAYEVLSDLRNDYPRWADAQCDFALVAEKCGRKQIALGAMRRATELMQYHPRARRYLAEMLSREGFHDHALSEAQEMYEGHPSAPEAVRLLVNLAIRASKPATAETVLARAMRLHTDRPRLMLVVSDCYRQMGQMDLARKAAAYVKASASEGGYSGAILAVRALMGEQKYLQASSQIQALLKSYPGDHEIQYLQAELLRTRGQNFLAVSILQALVAAEPDSLKYQIALAVTAFDVGQFDLARSIAAEIKRLDPANVQIATLLQQIAILEGKASDTENAHLAPIQMAARLLQAGKPKEALELCRRTAPASNDPIVWTLLAQAQLTVGNLKDAAAAYGHAITLRPQRLAYYQAYLRVRLLYESLNEAVAGFVRVADADHSLVKIAHAQALAQRGNVLAALTLYVEIERDDEAKIDAKWLARFYRAELLSRVGQFERALETLNMLDDAGVLGQRAELLKVAILIRMNKQPESFVVLDELGKRMVREKNSHRIVEIAQLWMKLGHGDRAMALAKALQKIVPGTVEPLMLESQALTVMKKFSAAEACLQTARTIQPDNQTVLLAIARSQANRREWNRAVATLGELEATKGGNEILAKMELAGFYLRWGLARESSAVIESLLSHETQLPPRAYLMCAQAYLVLDDRVRARAVVESLSATSQYFSRAWLMLASAEPKSDARMAIYQRVLTPRPSDVTALGGEMMTLIEQEKFADASARFAAFVQTYRAEGVWPANLASLALAAEMKNRFESASPAAIALVKKMAAWYPQSIWRLRLLLLRYLAGDDDWLSRELVAPKGVYEVTLRVLSNLRESKGKILPVVRSQWAAAAAKLPKEVRPYFNAPVEALISPAPGSMDPEDAKAMVLAILTSRAKLPGVAALLRTRWEASSVSLEIAEMLWRLSPTEVTLDLLLKTIPDQKSRFYRRLAGDFHLRRAHITGSAADYTKAISLYEALTKEAPGTDPHLDLLTARAFEQAGHIAEAERRYRVIFARTKSSAVANNLAFLLTNKPNTSAADLQLAETLSKLSQNAAPSDPAVLDTRGWVLLKQGHAAEALTLFRTAVVGLSKSPQMQYHLGLASQAAGKPLWAKRHFHAAIDLGRGLKAKVDAARKAGTLLGRDIDPADLTATTKAEALLKAMK